MFFLIQRVNGVCVILIQNWKAKPVSLAGDDEGGEIFFCELFEFGFIKCVVPDEVGHSDPPLFGVTLGKYARCAVFPIAYAAALGIGTKPLCVCGNKKRRVNGGVGFAPLPHVNPVVVRDLAGQVDVPCYNIAFLVFLVFVYPAQPW